MLDQYSTADRSIIYAKVSIELIIILLVVFNFYNGILTVLFGIAYLIVRIRQYNRRSIEEILCL